MVVYIIASYNTFVKKIRFETETQLTLLNYNEHTAELIKVSAFWLVEKFKFKPIAARRHNI